MKSDRKMHKQTCLLYSNQCGIETNCNRDYTLIDRHCLYSNQCGIETKGEPTVIFAHNLLYSNQCGIETLATNVGQFRLEILYSNQCGIETQFRPWGRGDVAPSTRTNVELKP